MLPVIRRPCGIRPVVFAPAGALSALSGGGIQSAGAPGAHIGLDPSGTLYADLSTATAATINAIRTAFQVQKLLERDARGGTRYTEIIRSHFGVVSPDSRLQRPIVTGNPIAQTSGTSASGTTTPLGNLAAMGSYLAPNHGFTQSFTEHGVIIGLGIS